MRIERLCPDCGTVLNARKTCDCGWKSKPQAKADISHNQLCVVRGCQNPGTARHGLRGSGPWFCRGHVNDSTANVQMTSSEPNWRDQILDYKQANPFASFAECRHALGWTETTTAQGKGL